MKRAKTLTAGILSTIAHTITSTLMFVVFVQFLALIEYIGGVIALIGLLLGISVVGLVMAIITIVAWNKETKKFKKKYACIITGIVADFAIAIYSIISIFSTSEIGTIVLWVLIFAFLIISTILKIIDLATENKKTKSITTNQQNNIDISNKNPKNDKLKEASEF